MTEDDMKTKACHKTHRGETLTGAFKPNGDPMTFSPQPAACIGSECMAFRAVGNSCYCADLKRDA